jgi:hypothetical protein
MTRSHKPCVASTAMKRAAARIPVVAVVYYCYYYYYYYWLLVVMSLLPAQVCSPFLLVARSPPPTRRKWTSQQRRWQQQQQQQYDDSLVLVVSFMTILAMEESDWKGAGLPREDLSPDEIPTLLMQALRLNDFPETDSGLQSLWAFASDTTRHLFQQNYTDFCKSAHETARQFPTSFYGNALVLSASSSTSTSGI